MARPSGSRKARGELTGKVALVTACSRGIGEACALALARAGADLVLGLHDVRRGAGLARRIERMGRQALPVQMDVSRLDQIRSAVREAVRRFGRIDVLANNAGVGAPNPAERGTEKDLDETVAVNLKGTFFVAQAVAKVMIRQKRGRIVNIGSQAGAVALPTESVYCM